MALCPFAVLVCECGRVETLIAVLGAGVGRKGRDDETVLAADDETPAPPEARYSATMPLRSRPTPEISTSTVSPGFM